MASAASTLRSNPRTEARSSLLGRLSPSSPLVDLYAEYRRFQADGFGRHGNEVEESELFEQSPLIDVRAETLEVAIPVPDGETYWRWSRSHGSGRFIDGLPDDKRNEMHARLLERVDEIPDFVLRRSATLWTARKTA